MSRERPSKEVFRRQMLSWLTSGIISWTSPFNLSGILAWSGLAASSWALSGFLLAACATTCPYQSRNPGPQAPPEQREASGEEAEGRPELAAGTIIKMPEGKPVSFEEMMRDLRRVRIVYLGESHNNMAHHEGQLAVIKGLQQQVRSVAIGMEMFQRPYQEALDAWVAGELNEKQFIERTDWYGRWSMDLSYYEPILRHAREQGKSLLALNAPDELVQEVGSKGLEGLSPEQRKQLPEIDLGRAEHRHFIEHLYQAQAGHHQASFERFYEAQRVWDETMAETVASYLRQPGAAQVVAVIAGNGHIEYGLGVPDDTVRRLGAPYRTVSFQAAGQVTWGPGPGPPTPMFDYGRPLADYVWLTTEAEEQERPKLGVMIGEQAEGEPGVKVTAVAKGSPAAKAGLEAGDVILTVDGEEVNSLGDLRYELSRRQMGDRLKLEVLRGGKRASYEPTLSPLPKAKP
jgi:aminopeptidase N